MSRIAGSMFKKAEPLASRFKLPDKWKGGRIERGVQFWKGLFRDYREAVSDMATSAKERPLKAAVIASIGASCLYMNRHNPDEHSFRDNFVRLNQDLLTVPDSIRRPESERFQSELNRLDNQCLIRRWNFILFSVIWRDDFDDKCGVFNAKCEYLQPTYLDRIQNRLIDVGFLDRWWISEKKMLEYDVNPGEWTEDGQPTSPVKLGE